MQLLVLHDSICISVSNQTMGGPVHLKVLLLLNVFCYHTVFCGDCSVVGVGLELPNYYTEGVVFQADLSANFWGFTNLTRCPVTVTRKCFFPLSDQEVQETSVFSYSEADGQFIWNVQFSPMPSGQKCRFTIRQVAARQNFMVLFGEQYLYSMLLTNGSLHRLRLIGSPPIYFKITVSLWKAFLVL